MSKEYGAYVGVGYLLSEKERVRLLAEVIGTPRYDAFMENFHALDTNQEEWFFGEIVCDIDGGSAMAIDTIARLPALVDDGSFGIKYGAILSACGVSAEEINASWARPNIYICHWEDFR